MYTVRIKVGPSGMNLSYDGPEPLVWLGQILDSIKDKRPPILIVEVWDKWDDK